MNRNEQISAMLDGELTETEFNSLLESAIADDVQIWGTYSFVGDLIRSSELAAFNSNRMLSSISNALVSEPTVLAPVLATQAARKSRLMQIFAPGRARFMAASLMAVGFISFALNQAVPPLEGQVQMVRGQATESEFTDEELALWQEYFMAHQQNIVRGGLGGVAPLARVEADRPLVDTRERVILSNSGAGDWMNVWEAPTSPAEAPVQYNYVSTGR